MASLNPRTVLILTTILSGAQACTGSERDKITACFEHKTRLSVARVDDRNHRLFAIPESPDSNQIVTQIGAAEGCFQNTGWSKDWSVSVFADKKYAGYKDEPAIVPYHTNNEWAAAYLGEYAGPTQTYTYHPELQNGSNAKADH